MILSESCCGRPVLPKNHLHWDDLPESEYSRLYSDYRIVRRNDNETVTYQAQIRTKFLLFLNKWRDVGPIGYTELEPVIKWINGITNRPRPVPKEEVVWRGEQEETR